MVETKNNKSTSLCRLYSLIVEKIINGDKRNLREKFMGPFTQEANTVFQIIDKKYNLKEQNILGMGTSAIAFRLNNGKEIVKVVSKGIKYFREFGTKSAKDFKKHMDPLKPHILPMKEIIYDGHKFFVYTQEICKPIKKGSLITSKDFIDILTIIKILFQNGLLVGQLQPKNVGYNTNNQIVLFDYHSMHNLRHRISNKKSEWASSLIKSLTNYCSLIHASSFANANNNINIMKKSTVRAITQKYGNDIIQEPIKELLLHISNMSSSEKDICILCQLIDDSQIQIKMKYDQITSDYHLQQKDIPQPKEIPQTTNFITSNHNKKPNHYKEHIIDKPETPIKKQKKLFTIKPNQSSISTPENSFPQQNLPQIDLLDQNKSNKFLTQRIVKKFIDYDVPKNNESNYDSNPPLILTLDHQKNKFSIVDQPPNNLINANIYFSSQDYQNLKKKYKL